MNVRSILTLPVAIGAFLAAFCGSAAAQPYTLQISREPVEGGAFDVVPAQESYEPGTVVDVYAVPYSGFRFVEWQGDISATENHLTFAMTADTVLTAVFAVAPDEDPEYEVLVVAQPQGTGYVTRDPVVTAYAPGLEVTLTAVPGDGYVFAGWSGDVPEGGDLSQPELRLTVSEDLDITANFEAAAVVVPDGGANGDGSTPAYNTRGSAACGALGTFLGPITLFGLVIFRLTRR
jgi:hypothetical protein